MGQNRNALNSVLHPVAQHCLSKAQLKLFPPFYNVASAQFLLSLSLVSAQFQLSLCLVSARSQLILSSVLAKPNLSPLLLASQFIMN